MYGVEKGRGGKEEVSLWSDTDVQGCENRRVRQAKKRTGGGGAVRARAERSSPWGSGSSVPAQVQPVLCMDTCTKPPGWMHQGTCPLLASCLSPQPPEPGREEAFNQMWSGRRAGPRGGAGASPSSSPTSAP